MNKERELEECLDAKRVAEVLTEDRINNDFFTTVAVGYIHGTVDEKEAFLKGE